MNNRAGPAAAGKLGYIGFDIETVKPFPEGDDWRDHRPLGITCAAIWQSDQRQQTWCSRDAAGRPLDRMTREDASRLVDRLKVLTGYGYVIATWNGLGFDFDVLAEESGRHDDCAELARHHVDMMMHVFCVKGFPLGLNVVAAGIGLDGKFDGLTGADAVRLWADSAHDRVLEYVRQDAKMTAEIAVAIEQAGVLRWVSRSGKRQWMNLSDGWARVEDALGMPEPDTSWMSDPIARHSFTQWMEREVPK